MIKNADGTNKIFDPGEKCLTPTAQCFWKDPQDIISGVKTCSQASKQSTVSIQDYNYYFENKERIRQWILGTEMYIMKESDQFYAVNFHCCATVYH